MLQADGRDTGMAAVTTSPIRRWTAHAFGRSPLTRTVDRIDAWVAVATFIMLLAVVYPALVIGQIGYEARTQEIAIDTATRHSVDATALGASTAAPSVAESTPTTFLANVRWYSKNTAHEAVAKVDEPVKAGDDVQVWVTDQGKVTTAPSTDADAMLMKIGTVALSWLLLAILVAGSSQ